MPGRRNYRSDRLLQRMNDEILAKPRPPEDHDGILQRLKSQGVMAGFDQGTRKLRDQWNNDGRPMAAFTGGVDIPDFLPRERCIELVAQYGAKIFGQARASVARENDIDGIAGWCEKLSKGPRR